MKKLSPMNTAALPTEDEPGEKNLETRAERPVASAEPEAVAPSSPPSPQRLPGAKLPTGKARRGADSEDGKQRGPQIHTQSGAAKSWKPWALAALGGVLYVVGFPGIDQFYLAFFAFVPVIVATSGASLRRTFLLGATAGFVSHLGGYYWVVHLLQVFAHLPFPVAVLGWLLLCVAQGSSFGVGVMLAKWLRTRTGWSWALTLAVGLAAMDFVYPLLFPSYIANTMASALWMMQIADLGGVLLVTALLGAINGAFADIWLARRFGQAFPRKTAVVVGALWVLALSYGAIRVAHFDALEAQAPKMKIGMVQANVGGAERHLKPGEAQQRYVSMTRQLHEDGAELVVWPEGANSGVVRPNINVARQILGGTPQPMLFGGLRYDRDRHDKVVPFNSAFISNAQGEILGTYDKTKLLAFGEYIPGGDWFPAIYELLPYTAHFGRGSTTAPLRLGDWNFGTYICYEDIIPRFVQKIMVPHEGERPHVMVNITNDSWYGDTTEPPIHLALAIFRAVEHRRPLVRSTNTGISAFVSSTGRVVSQTKTYHQQTLMSEVPKMHGSTLYQHVGDWPGYGALLLLGFGWGSSRRKRG